MPKDQVMILLAPPILVKPTFNKVLNKVNLIKKS